MPQIKITLNDAVNDFVSGFPQFTKSDIINAALGAIYKPNHNDADNKARLAMVMVGTGIVVDAESHLRSALSALSASPNPGLTQNPALTPNSAANSAKSKTSQPSAPVVSQPTMPVYTVPPDMLDPQIPQDYLDHSERLGYEVPKGVTFEQVRKLRTQFLIDQVNTKRKAKEAQEALDKVENERLQRLKARGYREHDIQSLEELRKLGTAANPVMQAIQTNAPPAEPGEFPEIKARTYECIGPGGTKYPLTKEEWEAIKDEMTPGMQEAFATRDEWFHRPSGLFPWQMMVKAWILHADHSHSRSHFIPKEKPKFWSLNSTYTKNDPGFSEVGPHGTTFSHYCFHSDFFGGDKRFQWVRRYQVREPVRYMNFSFHDIIKALGCEQFLIWLVDMDLPHALHKQWSDWGRKLDKEKIDKDADGFDMDKHYAEFPPEMGFTVHEGHLWVNVVALNAMKGTVMRMMGDEGYDEFAEWVGVVDIGGHNRLIKGMVDDPDMLAASLIPRRREGIIDPSEFVEVIDEEVKPVADSGDTHDRTRTEG